VNEFYRYVLSIFVNLNTTNPGEYTGYYEILELITTYYQQYDMSISTDDKILQQVQ